MARRLTAFLLAAPSVFGADVAGDRTITQVVKLLQSMLDQSKTDGDQERTIYGKYKCYCDTNEASKSDEISRLTEEIGLLESDIDGLLASSAILSKEVEQLKVDMDNNVQSRQTAEAVRGEENTAFLALEGDLTGAIDQMNRAITVLSDIGSDQTLSIGADHQKFMASYQPAALVKLRATVKQAYLAASALATTKQSRRLEAFIQAPFTGTYTSQAGEVVGILKSMRDTFESNLKTARANEATAAAAHAQYMTAMEEAHMKMDLSSQAKQATLSTNDSDLSSKRQQLQTAQGNKAEAESFLESLLAMCKEKAEDYQKRVMLRANEEAAIAEAISILNSDAAFELFGTVTATKSGPIGPAVFFQLANVNRHVQRLDQRKEQAQAVVLRAGGARRSQRLSKIAALLQANNPFAVVLKEIDKMLDLIAAEESADDQKLSWCNSERDINNQNLLTKEGQISTLEGSIQELTTAIEDPVIGLKAMIAETEDNLQTNRQDQETETQDRTADNLAYQKNIENLVEAEELLAKAITVLKAYYDKIMHNAGGSSLLSTRMKDEPAPPPTWEGPYSGQGSSTDAIGMLEFILQNTKAEESAAHDAEKTSQHSYEDSMSGLKESEASYLASLAQHRLDLAEKEKELLAKEEDLKVTKAEKVAIEAYLADIKPGCDFITTHIDERKSNRLTEKDALESAASLLRNTPAYLEAVAAAHNETLGDCLGTCAGNEAHVDCKACLAHVSVPGYCAGHPGTDGCA